VQQGAQQRSAERLGGDAIPAGRAEVEDAQVPGGLQGFAGTRAVQVVQEGRLADAPRPDDRRSLGLDAVQPGDDDVQFGAPADEPLRVRDHRAESEGVGWSYHFGETAKAVTTNPGADWMNPILEQNPIEDKQIEYNYVRS